MPKEAINHNGHRKRLKDRFCNEGLNDFDEINALELLLFYCVPRRDTNPLAHRLLARFEKFTSVLEAPREELLQVEGVTENVAVFLSLIREANGYYEKKRKKDIKILRTIGECADYMKNYFSGCSVETVYLLCLDAKCKLLCCKKVGEGSVNSAPLSSRKVVETAILSRATSVVLAHNHPSGVAIPSVEDVQVTSLIGNALKGVDVVLVDHIIFGDEDYVSLVQSKMYTPELRENIQILEVENEDHSMSGR